MATGLFCASSILCKRRLVPHSESAGQTKKNFMKKGLPTGQALKVLLLTRLHKILRQHVSVHKRKVVLLGVVQCGAVEIGVCYHHHRRRVVVASALRNGRNVLSRKHLVGKHAPDGYRDAHFFHQQIYVVVV